MCKERICSRLYLGGRPPLRPLIADAGLDIWVLLSVLLRVVYTGTWVLSIGSVNYLHFVHMCSWVLEWGVGSWRSLKYPGALGMDLGRFLLGDIFG